MKLGSTVRIMDLNGEISSEIYTLASNSANGISTLMDSNNNPIRVNNDRLRPSNDTPTISERNIIMSNETIHTTPVDDDLAESTDTTNISTSTNNDTSESKRTIEILDLDYVIDFGLELWETNNVNFDHADMTVKSYVLLADNPVRKLCFLTYNGSLGKKANGLERLRLQDFKDNNSSTGNKPTWHILKHDLDNEREKLTGKGYTKIRG